ncbi:neutral zinc metallopeptidase [Kribbella sp. NPDC049584]|uniref:neutral zinc metallopeptidase n=1 Tax=Kribbella sp. NPDC049584 TaxID=3154833 RepID=UPI00341E1E62
MTPRASPAKPLPVIDPVAESTAGNKLYGAGKVGVVPCTLPSVVLRSDSEMLKYARTAVACMQKAWTPLILKSDAYYGSAQVAAFSVGKGPDSPLCDDPPKESDAFYQPKGSVICLDRRSLGTDPDAALVDLQETVAHEFGHHVQMSVGILTAYDMRAYSTSSERLEDERRLELQASCLGAAFLGANRRTFGLNGRHLEMWRDMVRHMGDEYNPTHVRDHGSRNNHGYWSLRGFAAGNSSACNTFTAPAKRVS